MVKGWKNLNAGLSCRDFRFEIGKTYAHHGSISVCEAGFHFHRNPFDLFRYYEFGNDTVVAEIEASGKIIDADNKSVCEKIKIVKILTADVVSALGNMANNFGWANTGDRNTGNRNTGDWNTGDWNTGNRNTGDWNTGNRNTWDWNKCNRSNGFFNTQEPIEIMVFNKPCVRAVWLAATKPDFLYFNNWPGIKAKITKKGIRQLKNLPNFDETVFRDISGYSLSDLEYFEILFRKF